MRETTALGKARSTRTAEATSPVSSQKRSVEGSKEAPLSPWRSLEVMGEWPMGSFRLNSGHGKNLARFGSKWRALTSAPSSKCVTRMGLAWHPTG